MGSSPAPKRRRTDGEHAPNPPSPVVVFAHGLGAPSSSDWMIRWKELLTDALGAVEVITFDYPYFFGGKRKVPPEDEKLVEFHAEVVRKAVEKYPEHPLILAGKSIGSRVSCIVSTIGDLMVRCLICLGYPLKGTNGAIQDDALLKVSAPMIFVQGSKDDLCPLDKLSSVCNKLKCLNELHVIDGGDHSFKIGKSLLQSMGSSQEEAEELAVKSITRFVGATPLNRDMARGLTPMGGSRSRGSGLQRFGTRRQGTGSRQECDDSRTTYSVADEPFDKEVPPTSPLGADVDPDTQSPKEAAGKVDRLAQGRGPNRPIAPITPALSGDDLFHPKSGRVLDASMPRQMSIAIKGRYIGVYSTWSQVPPAVQELMCQDWMSRYNFRPEDKPRARAAFMSNAKELFRGIMKRARDKAKGLLRTTNYLECIETGRPHWMRQDIWERLIRHHWATEKFQKESETNKKNRLTAKDGDITRHTGGSVSTEIHEKRLEEELGRPVAFLDVFDRTHRAERGKGAYKDKKSEAVIAKYKERVESAYGTDPSAHPAIDIDAYLYAAGSANKGRCYGLGSQRQLSGARGIPGYLAPCHGLSRRSASSHSTDSDQSSHIPRNNDEVHCRLDAIKESERQQEAGVHERVKQVEGREAERETRAEERTVVEVEIQRRMEAATATIREELLEQFSSSRVDPEYIKQAIHAAMQHQVETMRREILEQLRESERRVRAERRKENRARDESIVRRVLELVRADCGERDEDSDDDDSLPPCT